MPSLTSEKLVVTAAAPRKRQQVAARLRALADEMTPGERLPSVADLARQLGVAPGTVEAAVGQLKHENVLVSRPRSGTFVAAAAAARTDTLAVLATNSTPFYQACVDELVTQAAAQGLAVKCRYADHPLSEEDVLRFEAFAPAGFVVIGTELEWAAEAVIAHGHAAVMLSEPLAGATPRVPAVFADAEQGGYVATCRLLDLGHTHIAYAHRFGQKIRRKLRWQGHARALCEAGIAPAPAPTIERETLDRWAAGDTDGAVRAFFTAPNAPTALVAWSDPLAVMLLGALQRAGLRVPGDVSLIGYDNLPLGAHLFPGLDTVDQHVDVLVRHALFLVTQPTPATALSTALVTPTLVPRASCAAVTGVAVTKE